MSRPTRPRAARGRSRVGERWTAVVGPWAHGGHAVARVPDGDRERVVFVRHALPGERVELVLTEGTDGDRFWRADAVAVLEPSPDRVTPPCPYAGPGLCGGCDLQHATPEAQRALKTGVVVEQLRRLARLEAPAGFAVAAVEPLLGWRTRHAFVHLPDGRLGMRRHRSRDVLAVGECLIAAPDAVDPAVPGPPVLRETVDLGDGRVRSYAVARDGFWQVHPAAPRLLVSIVLELLAPRPGERALDLYAGVGLFAGFLAEAVGETGAVLAVEGSATACAHAEANLADQPQVRVRAGSVDRVLADEPVGGVDIVVLDPPREGAKRTVVEQVVARAPRAVAYVACDPAALARDVAVFAEHGWALTALRAYDLFPMTHHVECVALLEPTVP